MAPVPLLAFAVDDRPSRVEGALLVAWAVVALVGLARSGRELLAGEDDERVRRPVLRLRVGLGVLSVAAGCSARG